MKRPIVLHEALMTDVMRDFGLSASRDISEMKCRVEHEGISFLTISLPTLCDCFEQSLEYGVFQRFEGFKKTSRRGTLPAFLQGLFRLVFNDVGVLLDEPNTHAIYCIRQVLRFFKKLEIPCSPSRERMAERKFIETEFVLSTHESEVMVFDQTLDLVSHLIWPVLFGELLSDELVCGHGPGVTSDKKSPNGRFSFDKWGIRTERSYPMDLHAIPNFGCYDDLNDIDLLEASEEIPVKVVFVPKTLKSPRVIAIEPSYMQYCQQGLLKYMTKRIESHPFTRGSINFSDQVPNRERALRASRSKEYTTMDLSEASDRVHNELAKRIFSGSGIINFLDDARSTSARLPSGKIIILSKYASMGSALCFPVEACAFYTLILSAMHQVDGMKPSSRTILRYKRKVLVYGDDLIFPARYADAIADYLEKYLLKVNRSKTFTNGSFRESCGGDFYEGKCVKPTYLRRFPIRDQQKPDSRELMSMISTANQLYASGHWGTCQVIRDMVERYTGRIPYSTDYVEKSNSVREEAYGLYHLSCSRNTNLRYNRHLHCYEQRRMVFQPVKQDDTIVSYSGALQKAFRSNLDAPSDFVRSVKRGAFRQKHQWIQVKTGLAY